MQFRKFFSSQITFCYFHNIQTLNRKIASYSFTAKIQMTNSFKAMSETTGEENFMDYYSQMLEIAPTNSDFREYFEKNWMSCKESWSGCSIYIIDLKGKRTNNRVESKNAAHKRICKHTDGPALS